MPKLLNHPWTIAVVGALLSVILAEVGFLHLFSGQLLPLLRELFPSLERSVSVPIWVIFALGIVEATLILLGAYMLNNKRRSLWNLTFAGLHWKKSTNQREVWPICRYCALPLQPRIEPEQRKDRNGVPFEYTPESPNVLHCAGCRRSSRLMRPWDEILNEAHILFSSQNDKEPMILPRK